MANQFFIVEGDTPTCAKVSDGSGGRIISLTAKIVEGDILEIRGRKHADSSNLQFSGTSEHYHLYYLVGEFHFTSLSQWNIPSGVTWEYEISGLGEEEIVIRMKLYKNQFQGQGQISLWLGRDAQDQEEFDPQDHRHQLWWWGGVILIEMRDGN